ncbi:hypothetical protein BC828DRAFT_349314 [Blastocladiella britannica]|nr:hypothetical protein BC828DRAFT_349314 [Blastocladiella britannica]
MPPKNKKQAEAKVKKVVDDKTFGLKNKNKSTKVQKFVEEVKKQASHAAAGGGKRDGSAAAALAAGLPPPISKKEREAQKKAELAELFKPVTAQKIPFGVDPKSVLCAFFKAGICQKGAKCKFSHDVNVERKGAKIDVYADKRDKEEDTMDKWDQKKLEDVVASKSLTPRTTTDIVCKHFLEAIEQGKYGWFWMCPAGGDSCKYRHALPPGYVLKKKKDKSSEDAVITLEDFLETERHNLGDNVTPVTLASFTEWKRRRLEAAEKDEAESAKLKADAVRAGRRAGLSGRDLFMFGAEDADADTNGGDGEDDDGFDLSKYMRARAEADDAAEAQARSQAASAARVAAGEMGDEPPVEDMEALVVEDVAEVDDE